MGNGKLIISTSLRLATSWTGSDCLRASRFDDLPRSKTAGLEASKMRNARFSLRLGDHLESPAGKRYYNEQVFDEIAPRYDFVTQALSFGSDQRWKRRLVEALPPRPGAILCLDLACGTGDITELVGRRYPQGRVIGLDITQAMLDLAGRRHTLANLELIRQDMSRLPVADGSVDIVTGGYALRNAPDLEGTLDEIARVLKPGGWAAFLDFSKPPARFAQRLEYWLLKLWTGAWGFLLHGNHEVYSYIAESLRAFPDRTRLRELMASRGLRVVRSERYLFGVTEAVVAIRQ